MSLSDSHLIRQSCNAIPNIRGHNEGNSNGSRAPHVYWRFWLECFPSFLGAVGLSVLFALLYYSFVFRKRRKLLRFFGLSQIRKATIYLSRIRVHARGSVDMKGHKRSYEGTAIANGEASSEEQLRRLLNLTFPRSLLEPSSWLSRFFAADIEVHIEPCPKDITNLESHGTLIAFGSPGYNNGAIYAESLAGSSIAFGADNSQIMPSDGSPLKVRPGVDFAFIERIIDSFPHGRQRYVFYVAGLTELGTQRAADYLAAHWQTMSKDFSISPFRMILKFSKDEDGVWSPSVEQKMQNPAPRGGIEAGEENRMKSPFLSSQDIVSEREDAEEKIITVRAEGSDENQAILITGECQPSGTSSTENRDRYFTIKDADNFSPPITGGLVEESYESSMWPRPSGESAEPNPDGTIEDR